jgi:putative phosphoesterase
MTSRGNPDFRRPDLGDLEQARVGVIGDTHGLLRPEAIEALSGSNLIIHAGDAGKPGVLDALREIAPVIAVRGNVDRGEWAESLPEMELFTVAGAALYVLHDLHDLDIDPLKAEIQAVISGHSHRPSITKMDGVLYLNPGSAGPRRFKLPVTMARLEISGRQVSAQIVHLHS